MSRLPCFILRQILLRFILANLGFTLHPHVRVTIYAPGFVLTAAVHANLPKSGAYPDVKQASHELSFITTDSVRQTR